LRQTNVQNDTSVTSTQPTSAQQLAANKVATDPPVKKVRKIVPSSITVGEAKVNPVKRTTTTAQTNANHTVLGSTSSTVTSTKQQNSNVVAPGLPPSKANKLKNVGKLDMENAIELKRSKKDAVINLRKKQLNANNNK